MSKQMMMPVEDAAGQIAKLQVKIVELTGDCKSVCEQNSKMRKEITDLEVNKERHIQRQEGLEVEIENLEAKLNTAKAALEKLNFTDEKIVKFMNETPASTVMGVLIVVGMVAQNALKEIE